MGTPSGFAGVHGFSLDFGFGDLELFLAMGGVGLRRRILVSLGCWGPGVVRPWAMAVSRAAFMVATRSAF